MKRLLALSLSLFVLANTISVSQTQALPTIPKQVKFAAKLAGSLGFGILSCKSAFSALGTHMIMNDPFATAISGISGAIAEELRFQSAGFALTSGIISAYLLKSACNDIKN